MALRGTPAQLAARAARAAPSAATADLGKPIGHRNGDSAPQRPGCAALPPAGEAPPAALPAVPGTAAPGTAAPRTAASAAPTRKRASGDGGGGGSSRKESEIYEKYPHLAPLPAAKRTRYGASGGGTASSGGSGATPHPVRGGVTAAVAAEESPVPPPPRALRQTPSHLAASAQKAAEAARAQAEQAADPSGGRGASEPRVYRNPAKQGINRLRTKKVK